MSTLNDVKKNLSIASLGLEGLEMVADIAGAYLGHPEVGAAMKAIVGIVDAVKGGAAGTVTVSQVEDGLTAMRALLAANDKTADSELDRKFAK